MSNFGPSRAGHPVPPKRQAFGRRDSWHWGTRLLGLAMLAGFLGLRVWDPAPVEVLRLKVFDFYQILQPRKATSHPVVIVDLDEESLASLGQWPWPRDLLADLARKIFEGGAVALAFDMVFPEPDRLSPSRLHKILRGLGKGQQVDSGDLPDNDALLADVFRKTRVVIGQAGYPYRLPHQRDPVAKAGIATLGPDPRPFLPRFEGLVSNLPILDEAAQGLGFLTLEPGHDGIVRRIPAMVLVGETIRPTLSLELLRVATGQTTYVIDSSEAGLRGIVIAGKQIPTDPNGRLWVHYAAHDPRRYLSAKDVLAGTTPPDRLVGKLVLIGTSATGLMDIKATSLGTDMPGVEAHARLIETIMAGSHLLQPDHALLAEIGLAAVVSLLIIVTIPLVSAVWTLLLGGAIALGLSAASWLLYAERQLLVDVSYTLISSFTIYAALAYLNFLRKERRRRQVHGAFSQYLSPDLVAELAEHPEGLKLGGEVREMSILFSDVRGFTAISERLQDRPEEITSLINSLLTPLSEVVFSHGGTIDKYMGDCIMAFWNAPLDDPDHAAHACETALGMLEALDGLNVRRTESDADWQALQIGVGIDTGRCVVGNMGSDQRFDYTALGDTVNVASRLEGQTAAYGVGVIVGETTVSRASGNFATLELDRIRVKGKRRPERIYTLLGGKDMAQSEAYHAMRQSHETMLACYRNRDWPGARSAAADARRLAPKPGLDALYDLYTARIDGFMKDPPDPDWDGVAVAETK